MAFDTSNLPISGSFLLGIVLYAGASVWAGQLIGERMIETSGWQAACEAGLRAEVRQEQVPKSYIPERRCSSAVGWLDPTLGNLCRQFGDPDFNGAARRAEEEAQARRREIENRRLAHVAAKAGSQCGCAANVYKDSKMISLGLHAGSARLITLNAVSDLELGLRQALASPQCHALGGSES